MSRATLVLASLASALGLALTLLIGPRPLTLPGSVTGDAELAARIRAALPARGHEQIAVAVVRGGSVTHAGFGADEQTAFEVGSFAKALTGMLLAAQAEAGVVRLDTPAEKLLPGLPPESATLRELSQHRSGLPRVPTGVRYAARGALANLAGSDPYTETPEQVVALAAAAGLPGRAEPAYSNLGASVLGHALGAAEGKTYAEALRARVLDPLAMRHTFVATAADQLPAGRAAGRSGGNGRRPDPWISEGWAPAGIGVWSTGSDLGRLASAALTGRAPGSTALDPTAAYPGGRRIGLGWIVSEVEGRTITWHNGRTGGFSSFVGLDREAGTAVVVLNASDRAVDTAGLRLLAEASR